MELVFYWLIGIVFIFCTLTWVAIWIICRVHGVPFKRVLQESFHDMIKKYS